MRTCTLVELIMPKGTSIKLSFHSFQDKDTGTRITRLTPPDTICHRNYFYQKCFTSDGNHLVFGSAFEGPWNYYLLNLKEQRAIQLSEGKGDNTFGGFLSPDDRFLYYVKNGEALKRVNLDNLEETEVYRVTPGWVGYGTWVANSECTKIVGIEIHQDDWRPLTDWKIFKEFYYTRPRCRLFSADLRTGKSKTILEERQWLGHPIYRPGDDTTIAFCHEGPHDEVDARMWLVNEDGTHIRKVKEHAPGESCTHEFWVPDGSALAYVSYFKGKNERMICAADPITLENRQLMPMPACSHLMSNHNGTLMVGDGADTPVDVTDKCAYKIENDPYLYLFNIARKTSHRIARHDSSWKVIEGDRQVSHPHPSFTPDEKQILFSCDKEGQPALYLADIPEEALK